MMSIARASTMMVKPKRIDSHGHTRNFGAGGGHSAHHARATQTPETIAQATIGDAC